MKMISARQYRNDLSDIVGILLFAMQNNNPIAYRTIENAIIELYDSTKNIKSEVIERVKKYSSMNESELSDEYSKIKEDENKTLEDLQDIDNKYKGVVNEASVDTVIAALRRRENKS